MSGGDVSDEPTPWELQRALAAMRQDLREGFKSVNDRLDRVPTSDLMAAWQARYDQQLADIRRDVAEIQEDRKHEARERAKASRAAMGALVTAFVAPIVVAVIMRMILGGG